MTDDARENVELRERIITALWEHDEGAGWNMNVETRADYEAKADAVIHAIGLGRNTDTYWTLYNAAEQAHRMSLTRGNDGVWTIEAARERMAPYHQEGDGYEVVERTRTWWTTTTEFSPLPVPANGRSPE